MAFDHKKYRPYHPINKTDRRWPNATIEHSPKWCSVDLRDGNQALIDPMTVDQKDRLFSLLVEVGFKEIEVGFPAASQTDFDFVRSLIEQNKIPDDVTIQVLTQARHDLIERTYEALKGVKQAVVHLYNSTSPTQREKVFKLDKQGIVDIAVNGAKTVKALAAGYPETHWTFQYSPESFSATEPEFAVEICNAVLAVWQPTPEQPAIINLPSTVEMTTPNVFADQIEYMHENFAYRDSVILSVHTHNDRGCAVAAAELAILAGAQRVEGTLLGNGERTGNMDIVTMAMNLYSQGIDPTLDLSGVSKIVQTIQDCTQLPVHPRHPYVGELVYTAFSGSHQDAINKCLQVQHESDHWDVAYLPIDPTDVGRSYQEVVRINSQSGKGGVAFVLEQIYGFKLPRWMQIALSKVVQKRAEGVGKEISVDEIYRVFTETFIHSAGKILNYDIHQQHDKQRLDATIETPHGVTTIVGIGNGPLEAFLNALMAHDSTHYEISDYQEHAMGAGSKADAAAYIAIKCNDQNGYGVAIQQDSVLASLQACYNAVVQAKQVQDEEQLQAS
ncbi:2-isopropylmalate synthase [Endozoicomonas sp. SM1973]|uniref:2-isopropylmalate synthase n=1 Tax=Spartinivicinus marinus TaxID=2994442 RepID=A0A853INA9_9GAMM|nr:2-isopropylmalate synthase [Spartinivicinus marinus]MCX4027794.1 2-isopropylmalate synthase [Spartinivicinus marinus]NYZ69316.1 2-isopropylmalate synthase [Spartinivicinus marinus]